jgi:predicted negative regulator of RcsB-dependent stress response
MTKILIDRATAEQALEALETCGESEWHSEDDFGMEQTYDEDKVAKAITALRTALEQPERELQQAIDALLLSSKPSGLTADQVRIKE